MCVVSMVIDHKTDEWTKRYWTQPYQPVPTIAPLAPPTREEIDEFRRLLDRAREYDKRNHEPDCELESKRAKLRDMAKQLGVEIAFL